MRSLVIIGFAVGAVLAGCASTRGARSEPTTSAAAAPALQHDQGDGGQALGSGGEPAPANAGDADHDAHHPGK